jgi:hypothetical protein
MSAPTYLEFDLAFLITRSGITNRSAARRLNGVENTVAALARRWREERPIAPATELRMTDWTRSQLLAWVTGEMPEPGALAARFAPYTSGFVCDASVPAGWIRLWLGGAAASSVTGP